jgi:branched-chain amino acid transport system substrate-binding protein
MGSIRFALLAASCALAAGAANAEITVGVSLGTTGPGASLGVHYKQRLPARAQTLAASRCATSSSTTHPSRTTRRRTRAS